MRDLSLCSGKRSSMSPFSSQGAKFDKGCEITWGPWTFGSDVTLVIVLGRTIAINFPRKRNHLEKRTVQNVLAKKFL